MFLLTAFSLLACSDSATKDDTGSEAEDVYDAPDALGPYPVGTAASETVGSTGLTIPVQIWYPAAAAGTAPYSYLGLLEGLAWDGVSPDCSTTHPVVVFSHGNGGLKEQSIFLTEYLASHGYIVVAPDHVYNTFTDDDESKKPELIFRRPVDVSDAFDWLLDVSAAGEAYAGCVDADDGYAVAGHSFGGYTTFAVAGASVDIAATAAWCADNGGWLCDDVATWAEEHPDETVVDLSDSRAWAALPMSPAAYEVVVGGLTNIDLPVMTLAGTWDELTPWDSVSAFHDTMVTTPRYLGGIDRAGHYTFSNACDLLPSYDDCRGDYVPPEEAHAVINTLAMAFLQSVRGETRAAAYLPPNEPLIVEWDAVE